MSRPALLSRTAAIAAVAGGLMVAAGAAMPWLTLYGGLHPMRGVMGLHGQVLLAAGVGCVAIAAFVGRSPRLGGWVLLGVAAAVLAFTGWLLVGALPETLASLEANPFLVAQAARGPQVILLGGGVLLAGGVAAVLGGNVNTATPCRDVAVFSGPERS